MAFQGKIKNFYIQYYLNYKINFNILVYSRTFGSTAIPTLLTRRELLGCGYQETYFIRIQITGQNGGPLRSNFSRLDIERLQESLKQNSSQVATFSWVQTNDQDVQIIYTLNEPMFLAQISRDPCFDFYEVFDNPLWFIPPVDHEYKLSVYHAQLLNSSEVDQRTWNRS